MTKRREAELRLLTAAWTRSPLGRFRRDKPREVFELVDTLHVLWSHVLREQTYRRAPGRATGAL